MKLDKLNIIETFTDKKGKLQYYWLFGDRFCVRKVKKRKVEFIPKEVYRKNRKLNGFLLSMTKVKASVIKFKL